jgi:hypothetical protein
VFEILRTPMSVLLHPAVVAYQESESAIRRGSLRCGDSISFDSRRRPDRCGEILSRPPLDWRNFEMRETRETEETRRQIEALYLEYPDADSERRGQIIQKINVLCLHLATLKVPSPEHRRKRESRLGIHFVRALGRRGRDLDSMRTALKETEIRGRKITEGDWVVVWNASATRERRAGMRKTKGLLHVERNRNGYLGGRPQSACADLPR